MQICRKHDITIDPKIAALKRGSEFACPYKEKLAMKIGPNSQQRLFVAMYCEKILLVPLTMFAPVIILKLLSSVAYCQ